MSRRMASVGRTGHARAPPVRIEDGRVGLGELGDPAGHQGAPHVVEALEAPHVEEQVEARADARVHEVADVADDEPGVVEPVAADGDVDGLADVVHAHRVPAAVEQQLGVGAAAAAEVDGATYAVGPVGLLALEEVRGAWAGPRGPPSPTG